MSVWIKILSLIFSWPLLLQTVSPGSEWLQIAFCCNSLVEQHVFFFLSERQLMRSSLALLQSKVWHSAPWYQEWDKLKIIFRYTEGYYATQWKTFGNNRITEAIPPKHLQKDCLCSVYGIIRLFVTSSQCWAATSFSLSPEKWKLLCSLWRRCDLWYYRAGWYISPGNYWDTCHRKHCWSWNKGEITISQWVKETAAVPDLTGGRKKQIEERNMVKTAKEVNYPKKGRAWFLNVERSYVTSFFYNSVHWHQWNEFAWGEEHLVRG